MGSTAQTCASDMHHCTQIQLSTSGNKKIMLIAGIPAQHDFTSQAHVHLPHKVWNANESPGHSNLVCNSVDELPFASADKKCAAMSKAAKACGMLLMLEGVP